MARSNNASNSNYLSNGSGCPVSGLPVTIAGWAYVNTGANSNQFVELYASGLTHYIRFGYALTGNALLLRQAAGGSSVTLSSHNPPKDTWFHFAAVIASATSAIIYLNGTAGTDTNMNRSPSGLDRCALGIGIIGGPTQALNGCLAEIGVWNVALSPGQIADLATNDYCPALVDKADLKAYWKVLGNDSPEPDSIGAYPMTITGTMSQVGHPSPIYYASYAIDATDATKAEGG